MLGGKSPSLVVPAALPLNRMRRPFSPDVTIFSRNPHGHSRQARGQGSYLSSRADAAGVVPEIERLDVFIPRRGRIPAPALRLDDDLQSERARCGGEGLVGVQRPIDAEAVRDQLRRIDPSGLHRPEQHGCGDGIH
jgi:hypothetical protein